MDEASTAARVWVPRGLAVAAFAMYALAAPSGWYWLDSGELSASAVAWGSPHPTGFPLYCILAKAATLVPFGELAFRVNLLSAAMAALTVLWVARLVCETCRDDVAAVIGAVAAGAVLALCLVFFRNATVAEVYVPTAALLALTLLLFARVARGADARSGLLLALVVGLGLGTHASFRLLMALPIAVLLVVRLWHGARWPLLAPLLALGVALAVHLYLPVRSASGRVDAVDWGHPRTAGALFDHAVTAKRIRTAFAGEMFSNPSRHAGLLRDQVVDQLGPLALLAALAGLGWLAAQRRERWLAGAVGVVIVGDAVYSVGMNPMGMVDGQNGVPLVLGCAVAAGAGVAWLARSSGRAGPFVGGTAALILIVPVALTSWGERWAAAAGDGPRAWSEAGLASVPPRGVALVQRDDAAAGMLFLIAAEQARPDAAVLVRQHLWDVERNAAVLARSGAADVQAARVLPSLMAGRRAIGWELGIDRLPPEAWFRAGAPLGEVVRGAAPQSPGDVRAALEGLERIFAGADAADPNALRVHATAMVGLGRVVYERGALDLAAALFGAAAELRPQQASAHINLGVVVARRGDPREAAQITERAVAIDEGNTLARINAARYWMRAGEDPRAVAHVERVLELEGNNAAAWTLAGTLDARAGRYGRARKRLAWALLLDPSDQDARRNLLKLPR